MMPYLNGLDFIKEYRVHNKITSIVMITATSENKNSHKESFELGTNDFISKPINALLFKARINSLLINYSDTLLLNDKAKLLEEEIKKATEVLLKEKKKP